MTRQSEDFQAAPAAAASHDHAVKASLLLTGDAYHGQSNAAGQPAGNHVGTANSKEAGGPFEQSKTHSGHEPHADFAARALSEVMSEYRRDSRRENTTAAIFGITAAALLGEQALLNRPTPMPPAGELPRTHPPTLDPPMPTLNPETRPQGGSGSQGHQQNEIPVKHGDSLWKIAKHQLPEGASNRDIANLVSDIARLNFNGDQNRIIHPGDILKLPPPGGGHQQRDGNHPAPAHPDARHPAPEPRQPTPQPGETTPHKPDQGEWVKPTPRPGETTPHKPDQGESAKPTPQPGETAPHKPDQGEWVKPTPKPGETAPHKPDDHQNDKRPPIDAKDVATEKHNLSQTAESKIHDPEKLHDFKENMEKLEKRSKDKRLPDSEVAKTYHEVSRLLNAEGNQPTSPQQREKLAEQVMHNAATPTDINQGLHNTCNVTDVETRTYTRTPSEAARLVADVGTTGSYTDASGVKVNIKAQPHDESGAAKPGEGYQRSYASEVFQVTAVNLYWEHNNIDSGQPGRIKYEQQERTKSDETDTGERLTDTRTGKEVDYGGKKARQPLIQDEGIVDANNWISGKNEKHVMVETPDEVFGTGKGVDLIGTKQQLDQYLARAKTEGNLPIIVAVHTGNEPFYTDSGAGAAGGSGGWHVVTVTDYQPGNPPKVAIENTWGKAANHDINQGMSVDDLFKAMHKPTTNPNRGIRPGTSDNADSHSKIISDN